VQFNKILVPVSGTQADEETVKLACQMARKSKGKILAAYVVTVKRSLPLDAEIESESRKAEGILDHVERIAEEEDYEVETDLLQARDSAPAIVDEAVEREVDLILIGITYKRRFGQFSLGNIVPYVLKNAPCRVILYHQYAP